MNLVAATFILSHLSLSYGFGVRPYPRISALAGSSILENGRAEQIHHIPSTGLRRSELSAKLWDRLEVEEDDEPYWYLINCVATNEMDLLRQCRQVCADMPDAVKFVVPTEQKTRSHGAKKMVTETKVKYAGYVFGKLRLCPEVYEAIQELDLCRSWMGTVNRKGYRKLPPAPLALNDDEVAKFGLEEYEDMDEEEEEDVGGVIVDIEDEDEMKSKVDSKALQTFLGLKVEDMVKVTARGKFFNEDGIIRRLKDGKIFVRFFTYGSMFEEWLNPSDVRKLNEVEVLRGLSGPSQPITQDDIDRRQRGGRPRFDDRRPGDVRRNLMGAGGAQRNRRQDRTASRFRNDHFDSNDEAYRNDKNWNWYKDQQNQQRQGSFASDSDFNYRRGSHRDDDWAVGDVDSQWGRKSQRQNRRENRRFENQYDNRKAQAAIDGQDDWSAFVSPSPNSKKDGTDDFVASMMDDLSKDLGRRDVSQDPGNDASTDFFDSLATQLANDLGGDQRVSKKQSHRKDDNDNFFAALEAELGSALGDDNANSGGSLDSADDFFAQLESELQSEERAPSATKSDGPSDFFSSLEESDMQTKDAPETEARFADYPKEAPSDDDFFAQLEAELKDDRAEKTAVQSNRIDSTDDDDMSSDDFFAQLEAELSGELEKDTASIAAKDTTSSRDSHVPASSVSPREPVTINSSGTSLEKCTVPVLKDMLRERGLKVSGKKSDLIERLLQAQ